MLTEMSIPCSNLVGDPVVRTSNSSGPLPITTNQESDAFALSKQKQGRSASKTTQTHLASKAPAKLKWAHANQCRVLPRGERSALHRLFVGALLMCLLCLIDGLEGYNSFRHHQELRTGLEARANHQISATTFLLTPALPNKAGSKAHPDSASSESFTLPPASRHNVGSRSRVPANNQVLPASLSDDTERKLAEWTVSTMSEFYNKFSSVSNWVTQSGDSIMESGDTIIVSIGSYTCTVGTNCAAPYVMLSTTLSGQVKCTHDGTGCVIDGQHKFRGMDIWETGNKPLTLRAITFKDGYAIYGGGLWIAKHSIVDFVLCTFLTCSTNGGKGGAILFDDDTISPLDPTVINFYGATFIGNTAEGYGDDIFIEDDFGVVSIHNTCPSPYSSPAAEGKHKQHTSIST